LRKNLSSRAGRKNFQSVHKIYKPETLDRKQEPLMRPNWVENLFLQNARKLYLAALGITGQRELAEDAVHDAMVC
jgi:DNA-directed RNA polymerase specialized sigma24 family protein